MTDDEDRPAWLKREWLNVPHYYWVAFALVIVALIATFILASTTGIHPNTTG